jgi:hypothetical protein
MPFFACSVLTVLPLVVVALAAGKLEPAGAAGAENAGALGGAAGAAD